MEGEDREDVAFGRRAKEELRRQSVDRNRTENDTEVLSVTYDDEIYSMKDKNRGKCIIFNHTKFTCGCEDRPNSGLDVKALGDFFGNRGFDVKVYDNKKVSQIDTILETESQKEYHNKASCFVCCVLTHGQLKDGEECLYAENDSYPTERLFAPFAGNKCKPLAGKPKLFFIEACRGEDYDPGVNVLFKLLTAASSILPTVQASYASPRHIREPLLCCRIPVKADFLVAYSTAPKSVAWSRKDHGSWFIQSLCEVLEARADDSDLLSMLTIVCRKVSIEYESFETKEEKTDYMKQVPSIYSTLTKMVKFPPKKN